jgi:sec-independent protein translocase protein TatA
MFEGLLQPMHLVVILGCALLFFGPKKLAERGKGLAAGLRELKESFDSDETPRSSPKGH